jgi:hypothetical protein
VFVGTIPEHGGPGERIAPGPLSIWLSREPGKRGAPFVCGDARAADKALFGAEDRVRSLRPTALAVLARRGWSRKGPIKSAISDRAHLLPSARARPIEIRMDIEAQARGIPKTFGIRRGRVSMRDSRRDFRDPLAEAVSGDPIPQRAFASRIRSVRPPAGRRAIWTPRPRPSPKTARWRAA